jgi:hypothetical protein
LCKPQQCTYTHAQPHPRTPTLRCKPAGRAHTPEDAWCSVCRHPPLPLCQPYRSLPGSSHPSSFTPPCTPELEASSCKHLAKSQGDHTNNHTKDPNWRLLGAPSFCGFLLHSPRPPSSAPPSTKSHQIQFKSIFLLTVYIQKRLEKDAGSGGYSRRGHACAALGGEGWSRGLQPHPDTSLQQPNPDPSRGSRVAPTLPLTPFLPPSHLPARPPPTLHRHVLQDTDFSYRPRSARTTRRANTTLAEGGAGRGGDRGTVPPPSPAAVTRRLCAYPGASPWETCVRGRQFASCAPGAFRRESGLSGAAKAAVVSTISRHHNKLTTKLAGDQACTLGRKGARGPAAL